MPAPPLLVAFTPPLAWSAADDPPPNVGRGSWITLDAWRVWRPTTGKDVAVLACFGAPDDTWTDEATPLAFDRLDPIANATLSRLGAAGPLHVAHEQGGDLAEHTLAGDSGASARTFVGFTSTHAALRLEACFVGCTTASPSCEEALARVRPADAAVPPPPPSAAVRALVLGVHHPRAVATTAIGAFVLAGALLVWRRPRGRRK